MTAVVYIERELSLGFKAKRLRISLKLTQEELSEIAGVSREDVSLLEQNVPLQLDVKRKILKELWARRASKR